MRDLERRFHEGIRREKLDQQIITGEADPEMHNCALSRPTWAPEGETESHSKAICGHEERLRLKGYPERQGEGGWDLREMSRSSSIVVVAVWRDPSVVVVGGRDCGAHLDAP